MSSDSHKRIAKNTMVLYVRMLITMAISIFTTRIVLEALGIVDYGIYNVVGSVVGFITMITGALTLSVQRYLNYELGKENNERVSSVFSSALFIHFLLAIALFIILETIGYLYFKASIKIPPDKYDAALIVFHLSAITAGITLISAPFTALMISFERMNIYAYVSIGEAILKLLIAYIVLRVNTNQLILYGILILVVSIIQTTCNIIIWKYKFKDVILKLKVQKELLKQISSFASWSALGQIAWAFTLQGTNILLNIFFGSILNAAYGVSSQVQTAVSKFVQSFQTAVNPQIIKSYAKNDYVEVISLSLHFTRISSYLLLVLIIPIIFQINTILNIWLTKVPEYTAIFCRIMLINLLFDTLSNIFATVIQATGKIRNYQLIVSLVLFLNFPLSYLCLLVIKVPYVIYIIYGCISLCLLFLRIHFVAKRLKISILRQFIHQIILPLIKVIAISIPFVWAIYIIIQKFGPLPQLIIFTLLSMCIISLIVFYIGFRKSERGRLISMVKSRINYGER